MVEQVREFRAVVLALLVLALTASPALAHQGEDHGGRSEAESVVLVVTSVVIVGALVVGVVRRSLAQEADAGSNDPARRIEE